MKWYAGAAIILAAGLAACTTPSDSSPHDAPDFQTGNAANRQTPQHLSADDLLDAQTRDIPGFAGLFVAGDEIVIAATTAAKNLKDEPRIRHIIGNTPHGQLHAANIRTIPARFTFGELNGWKNAVTRQLRNEPVTFIDLDEARNRVTIGILPGASRSSAIGLAKRSGLPVDALEIVEEPLPTQTQSLQHKIRPMVGGLEIGFTVPWNITSKCTLGLPVEFGSPVKKGFITASHCGRPKWKLGPSAADTMHFTQDHYMDNGWAYVGNEYLDPSPFLGGACPVGKVCRYSDALLVSVFDSVASQRGYIALTTAAGTQGPGSLTIGSQWGTKSRVAGLYSPVLGLRADKMGHRTGWTYGQIDRTCYNTGSAAPDPSFFLHLCQYRSTGYVDGGDSGSPVFYFAGSTSYLLGILWGGETYLGVTRFVFSPFTGVLTDLSSAGVQYIGAP